jgi:hypothetical protein
MSNPAARIVLATLLCLVSAAIAIAAPSSSTSSSKSKQAPPEETIENAWPKLNDDEMAKAVTELKAFAQETQTQLKRPLQNFETKYFLFYSDLPPKEAQNWASLLDRMYVQLADMFAVKKGDNIWRGKALIFVFAQADDYRRYEKELLHTDSGTSAGMCHSFGNGDVKIAFYRQRDDLEFAHVLVHESVHGFIHRYRTPVPVPSWANEGLAETIATDLVPQRGRRETVKSSAREELQAHKSHMGDFFTADHIVGWQYPVAEMLCTFMIQAGKKNYVDFIKGIKDGLTWEQSLEQKYKAPLDRLAAVYGQWLGVKGLDPS